MPQRPAFTLIELLVTLALIAGVISLSLVGIQNARVRSRDAKRIADLRTIQSALEQHALNDLSHTYPSEIIDANYCGGSGSGIYTNSCFGAYLPTTPLDPRGNQYEYHRPACLTESSSPGATTMSTISPLAPCVAPGKSYSYGLHIILESANYPEARNDNSPSDPKSYDLVP